MIGVSHDMPRKLADGSGVGAQCATSSAVKNCGSPNDIGPPGTPSFGGSNQYPSTCRYWRPSGSGTSSEMIVTHSGRNRTSRSSAAFQMNAFPASDTSCSHRPIRSPAVPSGQGCSRTDSRWSPNSFLSATDWSRNTACDSSEIRTMIAENTGELDPNDACAAPVSCGRMDSRSGLPYVVVRTAAPDDMPSQ